MLKSFVIALALISHPLCLSSSAAETDRAHLESWTAFSAAEISASETAGIQLKSNTTLSLPRGISTQALYVVKGDPASAAAVLRTLDPSKYPELEVFQQNTFRTDADPKFSELKIDLQRAPYRALLRQMTEKTDLQLSQAEVANLSPRITGAEAQRFWSQTLSNRWDHFVRDGSLAPSGNFDAAADLRELLREEPRIAGHFKTLLQPWLDPKGSPGKTAILHYWDVSETEDVANLELGALYERADEDRTQFADVTYYSSSGYIVSVSIFEFLPLAGAPVAQTLVWHETLLSSASIAGGLGIKRKFAARVVEDEMRKWITCFRRACAEGLR